MSKKSWTRNRAMAAYAFLALIWLVVSWGCVPRLIEAAHAGQANELFNRILRGKTKPLEHYLGLWSDLAGAVLFAGVLHALLMAAFLKCRVVPMRWLAVFSGLFLGLSVLSGARHDYVADLEIWNQVLLGNDPWWLQDGRSYPLNAYGPAFNLLAPLIWLNPLLPKLLFAVAYLGMVASRRLTRERWVLLVLNPLPWVEVAYFGHFDVLVGLACVAALRSSRKGAEIGAGLSLGTGILLKYLPIVTLPFLTFGLRSLRYRFIAACAGLVALGLGLSDWIWGTATFRPLTFATTRGATLLSLYRFLSGRHSPFAFSAGLERWSTPILAFAGLSIFVWSRWRRDRVTHELGAMLALLTTLTFYRVGFIQYQMVLLLVASEVLDANVDRAIGNRWARTFGILYWTWLAVFDLFYASIGGIIDPAGRWNWVEEWVGLPTFLLAVSWLCSILIASQPTQPAKIAEV